MVKDNDSNVLKCIVYNIHYLIRKQPLESKVKILYIIKTFNDYLSIMINNLEKEIDNELK